MEYAIHPLLAAEGKANFYRMVVLTSGIQGYASVLERSGAYIIVPPVKRERLDQRVRAAVVLRHEKFKPGSRIHGRNTVDYLSQHSIHINIVMHPLYNLEQQ
ncbi:hypothetical protein D3C73_980550 [compost metagenome]